jgi:hypothetical protein
MTDYPYLATVPLEHLRKNQSNPNEMSDREFNALCKTISEDGWMQPMSTVVPVTSGNDGPIEYEIVAGHHRHDAAKVLGHGDGPCWVLDPERFHQDARDMQMVKDNVLHGNLNPEKFAKLYERLTDRYEAEVVKSLMGFTSEDAFSRLYKEARAALPEEMQKALDAAKDEIKTIDDLSSVLNRLFTEFGETLDSNYMVFSWGTKEVFWVRADRVLWHQLEALRALVDERKLDISVELADALEAFLAGRKIAWEGAPAAGTEADEMIARMREG